MKQVIAPQAEPSTERSGLSAIPYDLLQDASRRVGILALLGGVLWVCGIIFYKFALPELNHGGIGWFHLQTVELLISIPSAILSFALFAYTRHNTNRPRFVLDLGLVYVVLISLAMGMIGHWDHVPEGMQIRPMISWPGVIVLLFAAIVPSSPARILTTGLLAASMNPLSMVIAKYRGVWDFGPFSNVILMHFPDYLLAGAALVVSHVITRLGRQVSKAREMGSYQLVRLLGIGGMGEVWEARHRMLARHAAIKLIQPELLARTSEKSADMLQRRFEQEAKTTAMLRSPHTVELYDFGVTESGVFYYVMEMLDGIDLATLVQKFGPQPPARVVHILRQICLSLGEAHQQQMIHRDIKPGNIFLCRMGTEYDFVKVLDFGLVKPMDTVDTQITGIGGVVGTPAYMAPEVALAQEKPDGRSDLYSLGCVAYWLLTGRLVFEEKGATAMVLAHIQNTPPSLPGAGVLERAVMACLAKKPEDRPPSAEELARALSDADRWTAEDAKQWWLHSRNLNPEATPDPSDVTASITVVK